MTLYIYYTTYCLLLLYRWHLLKKLLPSSLYLSLQLHSLLLYFFILSSNILRLFDIIRLFMFCMHENKFFKIFQENLVVQTTEYGCVNLKIWIILFRKRMSVQQREKSESDNKASYLNLLERTILNRFGFFSTLFANQIRYKTP